MIKLIRFFRNHIHKYSTITSVHHSKHPAKFTAHDWHSQSLEAPFSVNSSKYIFHRDVATFLKVLYFVPFSYYFIRDRVSSITPPENFTKPIDSTSRVARIAGMQGLECVCYQNAKYTSIPVYLQVTHTTPACSICYSQTRKQCPWSSCYTTKTSGAIWGLTNHSQYNTSLITAAANVFLVLNNKHHLITSQCLLIILPAMPHVNISSILFLSSHCLLIFASDPFKPQCANTWRTMTGAHGDKKVYNYKLISQFRRKHKKTHTYICAGHRYAAACDSLRPVLRGWYLHGVSMMGMVELLLFHCACTVLVYELVNSLTGVL